MLRLVRKEVEIMILLEKQLPLFGRNTLPNGRIMGKVTRDAD